jgi:Mg-chelatase subunit ChlD
MRFLEPIWIMLLIPVALWLWQWPASSRLLRGFRWAVWGLVILGLMAPLLSWKGRGGILVVVADRSESMSAEALDDQKAALDQLERKRPSGDQLAVVSFRRTATIERFATDASFKGFIQDTGKGASNLAAALDLGLVQIPEKGSGRMVMLSDGQWTGSDPAPAAARAALRGISIDYRSQQRPHTGDWRVVQFDGPDEIEVGQAAFFTAWYDAPEDGPVTYSLDRGTTAIASGTAKAVKGRNRLVFRDLPVDKGTLEYRLKVKSVKGDAVPENDAARLLVGVRARRPILCLTPTGNSSLVALLRRSGLEIVEAKAGSFRLSLARLSGFNAVLIENSPAREIGFDNLRNLAAWVQQAGGGLMTTGGERMYGQGGYVKSPLEGVLPISMELRRENRKVGVAIAVVLDRSGSMSMPAADGRQKIKIAADGAATVVDLLGKPDHVAVFAVDSLAHCVVKAMPANEAKKKISTIRGIESEGGGIFVYTGLKAAADELMKTEQKNRHIILFADAADAEQTDDPKQEYKQLIETCAKANIHVSVVGMGTEKDCDAEYLKDIARRGEGRIFFSNQPEDLPALFAEETFAVTGGSFVTDLCHFAITTPWLGLGGGALPPNPPVLGGYNVCFLKKEAMAAAVTTEAQDSSPIIAYWNAGAGRAISYMGEAEPPPERNTLKNWPHIGNFFTTMVRWAAGAQGELPDGMQARRIIRDGTCVIDLFLDPARNTSFSKTPDVVFLRERFGLEPVQEKRPLVWSAPDQLTCELPLEDDETVLPVIMVGDRRMALPPVCLPYQPEFAAANPGKGEPSLRQIAAATGGRERIDLASVWDEVPRSAKTLDLRPWCFLLAVLVLLLEVAQRRLAWLDADFIARFFANAPRLPGIKLPEYRRRRPAAGKPIHVEPESVLPETPPPPPSPEPEPEAKDDSLAAMRQARSQAGRRMKR